MYQLKYENKDIVIRFDKNSIDKTSLANMLEYLEIEQIRMESKLSEKDIEQFEFPQVLWTPS